MREPSNEDLEDDDLEFNDYEDYEPDGYECYSCGHFQDSKGQWCECNNCGASDLHEYYL